jgi:hypothetical protein
LAPVDREAPPPGFHGGDHPRRRQLGAVECEARRHGAADQCPCAPGLGGPPRVRGHNRLGYLPGGQIVAQDDVMCRRIGGVDAQDQRAARIVVPDLGPIHPVPVRTLARREQVVDGTARAPAAVAGVVAPRLRIPATLRMRAEAEQIDDGVHGVFDAVSVVADAPRPAHCGDGVTPPTRGRT